MSYITWKTKAGSVGTVAQSSYFEFILHAEDSNSQPLEYTHIAGEMPLGLRISTNGIIKGVPVIDSTGTANSKTSSFTVRANSPAGTISDRTFSITVHDFSPVQIMLADDVLGTFDDGKALSYQFRAITDNPNPSLTWKIIAGEAPIDMVTGQQIVLTTDGLLHGYVGRLLDTEYMIPGYDMTRGGVLPYDFSPISRDRAYTFTVQVSDGNSFDTADVRINVVSKGNFTADNTITIVNNTFLTVDADNSYPPIITTDVSNMPVLTAGDNYSFKFDAIDPENETVYWEADSRLAAAGMTISSITGWISGTIPPQVETSKEYKFSVNAYKRDIPSVKSTKCDVTLTTVRDSTDYISWTTAANLGIITNGSTSEITITAINNANKPLTYAMATGVPSRLPQGFKLQSNGDIVGRCSFQYFSLDGASANITIASTAGITTGMSVEGPGIASGSSVLNVYGENTVKIAPATYVTEGSKLSFVDLLTNVTVTTQLTDLSTTTSIDKNKTTFDCTFNFNVKATTTDGKVSDIKQFSLLIDNYNRAPYENIYLRALPAWDQREFFNSIINNTSIFPPELLYRPQDPNFGLANDIKLLFMAGLTASSLEEFALSMQKNHYNKTINFSNVRTARAVDENFNTKYEVVYVEITDDKQVNGVSTSMSLEPHISTPYMYEDLTYTTMYPNSFSNMQYRVASNLGYSNRGALPNWMTSRQEDGRVLGLTRAVVLAYTVPGASKLIAYRLKDNGVKFNNIQFVADRYQIGAGPTATYDTANNKFIAGKETSFDTICLTGGNGQLSYNAGNELVTGVNTVFMEQIKPGSRIYRIVNGTGTVSANGKTVTGIGTQFTAELTSASYIFANTAPIGAIQLINSDTSITLSNSATTFSNVQFQYLELIGTVRAVHSNTQLVLESPATVTVTGAEYSHSTTKTTFDTASTYFYSGKDIYLGPEDGDKYCKFTQIGVYR